MSRRSGAIWQRVDGGEPERREGRKQCTLKADAIQSYLIVIVPVSRVSFSRICWQPGAGAQQVAGWLPLMTWSSLLLNASMDSYEGVGAGSPPALPDTMQCMRFLLLVNACTSHAIPGTMSGWPNGVPISSPRTWHPPAKEQCETINLSRGPETVVSTPEAMMSGKTSASTN